MGAERWDEQVGTVADEAGRLLESLRRSAAEAAAVAEGRSAAGGPDADGARPASAAGHDDDHDHHHDHDHTDDHPAHDHDPTTPGAAGPDPVCQWCPICRGAAVVRSLSPETLTRLADLAGVAASVLADLASSRAAADPADPARPDASAPRRPTPATSNPIPVRDADDPQEAPRG